MWLLHRGYVMAILKCGFVMPVFLMMNANLRKESKYFCFLPLQVLSFQKFCLNLYQALLGKGSLYAIKITG
jgi:hypothetical protein